MTYEVMYNIILFKTNNWEILINNYYTKQQRH